MSTQELITIAHALKEFCLMAEQFNVEIPSSCHRKNKVHLQPFPGQRCVKIIIKCS